MTLTGAVPAFSCRPVPFNPSPSSLVDVDTALSVLRVGKAAGKEVKWPREKDEDDVENEDVEEEEEEGPLSR